MMATRRFSRLAGLELLGALVAERAVQSLAISEDFDVFEDCLLGLNACGESPTVDEVRELVRREGTRASAEPEARGTDARAGCG